MRNILLYLDSEHAEHILGETSLTLLFIKPGIRIRLVEWSGTMGSVGRNRAVAILLDPTSRSINSDVVTDATKYCRCPRLLLPTAETMPLLNSIPAHVKPLVIVSVATTVVLLSVVSYSHLKRMIPVNTKRLRVKVNLFLLEVMYHSITSCHLASKNPCIMEKPRRGRR